MSTIAFHILLSIICTLILPITSQGGILDKSVTNIPVVRHVLQNDHTYLDPVQGSAQIGYTIAIWLGTPPQKVTNHFLLLS